MFNTKSSQFTVVFGLILCAHLCCSNVDQLNAFAFITKPLIVGSLLLYFIVRAKHLKTNLKRYIILALVFSLIGDIALMFESRDALFFILGLVAFLIAHVMYILSFLKQRNSNIKPVVLPIILLLYASGLFYVLQPNLGELLIPVMIYMLIILGMATTASMRKGIVNSSSYNWVFIGALLFMISDSILALDKFYQPQPLSSYSIMITYAFAQYCIVHGILKSENEAR